MRYLAILAAAATVLGAQTIAQAEQLQEAGIEPFLGEPAFEATPLFEGERFPNVLVALDGTVVATWGTKTLRVRRSPDGGTTWESPIQVGPGIHGGGGLVDERTGDLLVFVHPEHPTRDAATAPRTMYRSQDSGRTWQPTEAEFAKDARGFVPSLHMNERGITLRHGEHAGRLVRAGRIYNNTPERYSTTLFSDDQGRSWQVGDPFPVDGTGEAGIVELSDGRLIHTARQGLFDKDEPWRHERLFAISNDGGQTWGEASWWKTLPDGPRYRGRQARGANYNGHFGMISGFERLPVAGRDILLYSNADHDGHERIKLTVWASFDGGKTWPIKRLAHEGLAAYSSLVAGRPRTPSEGWIYLQFEHGEGEKQYAGGTIARFNLAWVIEGQATGDGQLPDWLAE